MNIKKGIGLSIVLIALDQFIKLIIYNWGMDKNIKLIGDIIYFSPVFNKSISWISAKTGLNFSLGAHIVFTLMIIVWFIILGKKHYYKYLNKRYMVLAYWITLSGMICSAIDRIFWGTSLDYICIKGFFIFDLKDILVDAIYILAIGIIINEVENEKRSKLGSD